MKQDSLGVQLKNWRRLNGVKQAAVAFDLGVSQATVSRWEKGVDEPSLGLRRKIQQLIRVDRFNGSGMDEMLGLLVKQSQGVSVVFSERMGVVGASQAAQALFHDIGVDQFQGVQLRHMLPDDVTTIFRSHDVIDAVPHHLTALETVSHACAFDNMMSDVQLRFFHEQSGTRYALLNVDFKPFDKKIIPTIGQVITKVR